MNRKTLNDALKNYRALLKQVDAHIKQVETSYSDEIVCKKGCDSCCRFLSLFPVEAFALAAAVPEMNRSSRNIVREAVKKSSTGCPLLIDHHCFLYGARPVICRTHGYPLYFKKKGDALVDFCPKNFKGVTSFPKESLLDLEQLNTLLAAINKHFLESIKFRPSGDRIPISSVLLLLDEIDIE